LKPLESVKEVIRYLEMMTFEFLYHPQKLMVSGIICSYRYCSYELIVVFKKLHSTSWFCICVFSWQ